MSRCFPFPPPGYEKKTRSDDTDLLTKEKRKEKKHQKDKKDKDKREGKEKKDEERSKEKNREKKDRKEKKKDKKERNRDREKNRTSDEKRIEGKPASYNGEKPHPNNLPGVEISNSKIVQELGRRLGDKDKIVGSPMVQKVTLTDKGRPELEGSMVESNIGNSAEKKRKSKDKNDTGKANGQGNKVEARNPENAGAHNSGWMDQQRIEQGYIGTWSEEKRKTNDKNDAGKANGQGNKVQARVSENATVHNYGWMDQRRVAQSNIGNWAEEERKSEDKNDAGKANGQGNKVEARGPENATVHNSPWMDQRRTGQSIIGNWAEEKSKTKDKDDARKANGQENKVEAKGPESATVHTSAWMDQRRIEGMQVEKKDVEKQVKVKENNEHNGSHSRGDKKKDKDREKKSKSKDKHRNKKEKMEKMKGKREPDTKQTKLKGSDQASIDTQNIKSETLLKGNSESFAISGNLGKRKEHETNGLFHENRMQPNKLPRPIASSHPIVENGWKSDPSQIITQFAPEKQVLPFNHKADIKEHKINALAETQHSNSASMNSSSTTVQTTEKCEASAKQPHPDSKYLSQILSVPKIEECSNFDDQEWLFSSKNLQSKKMEVGSLGFDGTMQFPKGSFLEGMLTSGPDFTNSYCILLLIMLSQISSLSWCIREWFREGFRIPIRKLHETQCRIAESWLGVLFHCLESFITYLYSSTFNNFDL